MELRVDYNGTAGVDYKVLLHTYKACISEMIIEYGSRREFYDQVTRALQYFFGTSNSCSLHCTVGVSLTI